MADFIKKSAMIIFNNVCKKIATEIEPKTSVRAFFLENLSVKQLVDIIKYARPCSLIV